MKKQVLIFSSLLSLLSHSSLLASEVTDFQKAVKAACNKDLDSGEAAKYVESCTPGSKVDIEGCKKVACPKKYDISKIY